MLNCHGAYASTCCSVLVAAGVLSRTVGTRLDNVGSMSTENLGVYVFSTWTQLVLSCHKALIVFSTTSERQQMDKPSFETARGKSYLTY